MSPSGILAARYQYLVPGTGTSTLLNTIVEKRLDFVALALYLVLVQYWVPATSPGTAIEPGSRYRGKKENDLYSWNRLSRQKYRTVSGKVKFR